MMSIRGHTQTTATTYKSFHCTEVCCCLKVHLFILLCTLVFLYYESSLIDFSWWLFGDTRTQHPNYKSFQSIHSSLHPCLPLLWIISDCLLIMSNRRHTQTTATTYKSFHCPEVFCFLNVHPFILLCSLVFPYYESSLIVFSWWLFGDTLRQLLLPNKSFHCTEVYFCLNVPLLILLFNLVLTCYESSLIVFSWSVFRDTWRPRPPCYKSFHCT